MFRFGCLSLIVLAVVAAVWGYNSQFSSPRQAVPLDLAGTGANARFEWWLGDDWMPYSRLRIENARGRLDKRMWTDWGPARRGTFYLTRENWLVAVHPGGGATVITLNTDEAPKEIGEFALRASPSELWRFIGTVLDPAPSMELRFFSPSQMPECIPLFGAGSNFRLEHQDQLDCGGKIYPR
jgi:hypothetical protein